MLGLVSAPILLPALALLDLARGSRFAGLRLALFGLVYLACETAGLLAAFALWLLHAAGGDRERYRARTFGLQCWWAVLGLDSLRAEASLYKRIIKNRTSSQRALQLSFNKSGTLQLATFARILHVSFTTGIF